MGNLHYCEGLETTLNEALHPLSEDRSVILNEVVSTFTCLSLSDTAKKGILFVVFDKLEL